MLNHDDNDHTKETWSQKRTSNVKKLEEIKIKSILVVTMTIRIAIIIVIKII